MYVDCTPTLNTVHDLLLFPLIPSLSLSSFLIQSTTTPECVLYKCAWGYNACEHVYNAWEYNACEHVYNACEHVYNACEHVYNAWEYNIMHVSMFIMHVSMFIMHVSMCVGPGWYGVWDRATYTCNVHIAVKSLASFSWRIASLGMLTVLYIYTHTMINFNLFVNN